jgi:hypothetical protein
VPEGSGDVQVCYAVPTNITQSQIYFYDFYGPQLGRGGGQRSWQPLETTVTDGVACAPAQASGAYALIGQ